MPLFPHYEVFAKQKLRVNKRHGCRLLTWYLTPFMRLFDVFWRFLAMFPSF
jgi:hypothetical protein